MLDQSRLEATQAPARPNKPRRKSPGPTFWKLFTAFLFLGPALAVFLFGYLIYNAVSSDEEPPPAPPIQAPAEEAAPADLNGPDSGPVQPDGDVIYQDESGTWLNTKRGPQPGPIIVEAPADPSPEIPAAPTAESQPGQGPDLLNLGLDLLGGGGGLNRSGPASARTAKADQFYQDENGVWRNTGAGDLPPARSEHIYQDENGVWRNLSQSTGPDSASPAPVAASPAASLISGLLSQGGQGTAGTAPMDLLGGLLGGGAVKGGDLGGLVGSLMGGGQAGGDLSGLMGALMGGQGQGGGDLGGLVGALMGGGQAGGDLSALMGALTGEGQSPGDLGGLMESLINGRGLKTSRGLEEGAPLNVTRVRPQSFGPPPEKTRASQITSDSSGLNIEGYERFDPAQAGDIKSDWEFFDDPR